jgi:2-methylcitrate dehydratase PrpD
LSGFEIDGTAPARPDSGGWAARAAISTPMTSQQASAGAMALPPAKPISQIDAEAEAAFNTSTLIRWLDYNDT